MFERSKDRETISLNWSICQEAIVLFAVEIRRRRIEIFNSRPILILDHASIIFRIFHRDEKSVISLFPPFFLESILDRTLRMDGIACNRFSRAFRIFASG